jgi:hypothetical protein
MMVMIERKNVSEDMRKPPKQITSVSMIRIIIPTLMEKVFARNCAKRSVPPVLVSYLSIIPIPMPDQNTTNDGTAKRFKQDLVYKIIMIGI